MGTFTSRVWNISNIVCVCVFPCMYVCWGNDQISILKRYSGYSIGYTEGYQGTFAPIQASGREGKEEEMDLGDTSRVELRGQHILTHKKSIYIKHS